MKERPILFSDAMVRAILEGRKTVTRRVVKGGQVPTIDLSLPHGDPLRWSAVGQHHPRYGYVVTGSTEEECAKQLGRRGVCPYGQPGDRLWVRETFNRSNPGGAEGVYYYRADGKFPAAMGGNRFYSCTTWKPSIHMPRAASRIMLEITAVRVECLQDISEEQALAEGVRDAGEGFFDIEDSKHLSADPRESFASLWESINGAESWAANPWVWVVEFKRVTP